MTPTNLRLTLGALALAPYLVLATFAVASLNPPASMSVRAFVGYCFFIGMIAYPLVYFGCLAIAVKLKKKGEEDAAFRMSGWPLRFIVCLAFLFVGMGAVEILSA